MKVLRLVETSEDTNPATQFHVVCQELTIVQPDKFIAAFTTARRPAAYE
jgi:hypothetical protein